MADPISMQGAVDLGALAASRKAQAESAQAVSGAPAGVIKDVTTASFQADVIEQSMTVPVVLDLWASWCGPCKTLSPILERMAAQDGGTWVLAKVDVDAEQQIAAAFQVQSIPSVFAVIKGQPVPLFQGALPEPQIRQYLDLLLAEAAKNGVTGRVGGPAPEPVEEPEPDDNPHLDAAFEAIEAADWAAARAAYEAILETEPGNEDATAGLRLVTLYERTDGKDPVAAMQAAAAAPADLDVQFAAADVEALNADWAAAFDRLIGLVKTTAGDERATVRARLLDLFEIAGPGEPSVAKARTALANALF